MANLTSHQQFRAADDGGLNLIVPRAAMLQVRVDTLHDVNAAGIANATTARSGIALIHGLTPSSLT